MRRSRHRTPTWEARVESESDGYRTYSVWRMKECPGLPKPPHREGTITFKIPEEKEGA